jgi:hypothetical protein
MASCPFRGNPRPEPRRVAAPPARSLTVSRCMACCSDCLIGRRAPRVHRVLAQFAWPACDHARPGARLASLLRYSWRYPGAGIGHRDPSVSAPRAGPVPRRAQRVQPEAGPGRLAPSSGDRLTARQVNSTPLGKKSADHTVPGLKGPLTPQPDRSPRTVAPNGAGIEGDEDETFGRDHGPRAEGNGSRTHQKPSNSPSRI